MDVPTKAKELGITIQSLHEQLRKNPKAHGAVKIGKKFVFPDTDIKSDTAPDTTIYPDESDSNKKKAHFQAAKAEQEFIKIKRANDAESGKLVDRQELDKSYKEIFTTIRTKILALPTNLKRALGDRLPDDCEEILETMVNDLLEEVIANAS